MPKFKIRITENNGYALNWWGYIHSQDGKLKIKRYYDDQDLRDAKSSPFCKIVLSPVTALSRETAQELLIWQLKKEWGIDYKE